MTARVVVVGNEKGGSGKSTAAMHLIVALLRLGHSVAAIDLDLRQGTLTRYLENRRARLDAADGTLPMPEVGVAEDGAGLDALVERLRPRHEVMVIDTPGTDSALTRLAHAHADTVVTPLNDSFVDLDVLARVDGATLTATGPSHYAEMVWEQRKRRAARDGGSIDWIVTRNRLTNIDAHNKRAMARLLGDLGRRFGFRVVGGFGERVVYRELFLDGLTMMDLHEAGNGALNLSHVAARQEVRTLVEAVAASGTLIRKM